MPTLGEAPRHGFCYWGLKVTWRFFCLARQSSVKRIDSNRHDGLSLFRRCKRSVASLQEQKVIWVQQLCARVPQVLLGGAPALLMGAG